MQWKQQVVKSKTYEIFVLNLNGMLKTQIQIVILAWNIFNDYPTYTSNSMHVYRQMLTEILYSKFLNIIIIIEICGILR